MIPSIFLFKNAHEINQKQKLKPRIIWYLIKRGSTWNDLQFTYLLYYHVYLLRDIKFTGYVANHFDTRKLTFARQKSTLWIKQKKSNFDIDKTFRALKMITWSFSAHHTEKRLNADYTLFFKLNWKVFNFFEIKICS